MKSKHKEAISVSMKGNTPLKLREYYDLLYKFPQFVPWRIKKANKQLCDTLHSKNITAPMVVLDLGCGAGKNTKYLTQRGFKVVGIDFSYQALMLAKRAGIKSPLILADAFRLPFRRRIFDFIIDVGCFHCLSPGLQDLARDEIIRVLKPHGLYFLRLWHSSQDVPEILKPKFYIQKIPIWGFDIELVSNIFFKTFKFIHISKEIDEDDYGPFLILLLEKR